MSWLGVVGIAVFLVVSNGLIHLFLARRHAAVRDELCDAQVFLELTDVKASVSAKALFSASITWFRGDLLVTDRAIVFLPAMAGPIPMKQPPFIIVREGAEDRGPKQWGRSRLVAAGEPVRERSMTGTRRLAIPATAGRSRWSLRVQTDDLDSLTAAVRKFLAGPGPDGVYRKAAAPPKEVTAKEEPQGVGGAFSTDFLDRTPETGFAKSPFTEPIGRRDGVVCFESDATDEGLWEDAAADLAALTQTPLGECYYGAGTYAVEPFVTAAASGRLTGTSVLEALRVRSFRSDHITDLDRTEIAAPGYQAYTPNDEVHTDPSGQPIFHRPENADDEDEPESQYATDSVEIHERLRELVDGPLWYVLLHEDGGRACSLVALFAVGRSRTGDHLIGVASQQICHNLCD